MTSFGIRWLEIQFIIYISEQNGQHEKLNIINKDWDRSGGRVSWVKELQLQKVFRQE